jgi:hypothetical protein
MLKTGNKTLQDQKSANVRRLYDRYGGMLLGYLVETLKDRPLAEEYLVTIFSEIANQHTNTSDDITWCQLHRLAKSKLALLNNNSNFNTNKPGALIPSTSNKFLDTMTDEQKHIFCSVYYHGKPITVLSQQLNKPEGTIKKALSEAFAIIRNS